MHCQNLGNLLTTLCVPLEPCQSARLHAALREGIRSCATSWSPQVRCKPQLEDSVFPRVCVQSRLNLGLLEPDLTDFHMPPQSQDYCLLDTKEEQFSGNCSTRQPWGAVSCFYSITKFTKFYT